MMGLASILGHLMACFVYGALGVFLYRQRGLSYALLGQSVLGQSSEHANKQSMLFILSCITTSLWGLMCVLYAKEIISYSLLCIVEMYSDGAWCIVLISLLQRANLSDKKQGFFEHYAISLVAIFCALLALFNIYGPIWISHLDTLASIVGIADVESFYVQSSLVGQLFFAVLTLSLVEQLFRVTKPNMRWGVRYLCIGLFILFGYDFYMYANAVLFNVIDEDIWQARGYVSTLISPFIAITAMRDREWMRDIYPSQTLVFKSLTLILCGAYLLGIGGIGLFIQSFGGDLGELFEILFFMLVLMGSLVVLTSEHYRRLLKHSLQKHFFKQRYDYKREWQNFSSVLESNQYFKPALYPHHSSHHNPQYHHTLEGEFKQELIRALARLCESPKGLLFELSDNEEVYDFKTYWAMELTSRDLQDEEKYYAYKIPKNGIFAKQVLEKSVLCTGEDKACDLVLHQLNTKIAVALTFNHQLHGILLLASPPLHFVINFEVNEILKVAALQAATYLVQAKTQESLLIAKQFESHNKLATFVLHDLKNIITQLSLLNDNAKIHADNPDFIKSAFGTIENSVQKMNKLKSQMLNLENHPGSDFEKDTANTNGNQDTFLLAPLIHQVIGVFQNEDKIIKFENKLSNLSLSSLKLKGSSEKLFHVFSHLIQNALDAIERKGLVKITVYDNVENSDIIMVEISDNGCGMTPDFIHNSLFKPFVSTKTYKGMGIGMVECKSYLESLRGAISVQSKIGLGTQMLLTLPLG